MVLTGLKSSFEKNINRNAFCINQKFYTYEELQDKLFRISGALINSNAAKTKRVGIATTDTLETYASILACWFAGYAYVPLNPSIPEERNLTIIKEAKINVVLSSSETLPDFSKSFLHVQHINTSELDKEGVDNFKFTEFNTDTTLYILFTSGSTGVPKGVPITYGNVISFVDSYNALGFNCNHEDRFLQMFDLTFDVSVASYLIPLLLGACVYTVSSKGIKYMNVYKILKDYKISFASIVPSIITYLKPYFADINLPYLKYCILTAEASNIDIVTKWLHCVPNCSIVNLYGPTEATIWCTGYFFDITKPKAYNEMLVIGKPFKNVHAEIIGENGAEVKKGEKGELCISSAQLTIGYLNNEEKNQLSFFIKDGIRFYKTGDLCYVDENDDIFYCGRIDHQIKIQGFRIELSEIEMSAKEFAAVNNVAVAYKNKYGVNEIALFLENFSGNINELKKKLTSRLPYYMIPSQINIITELPYNTSGKVDRVKLSGSISA